MRIFAEALALLTGKKRQKVIIGRDFFWSVSWSYNIFRVYEIIFWRKSGIRLESISDSSREQTFFTLESRCVFYEWKLRNLFRKLAMVRMVILQPVGFRGISFPYIDFAIAFDAIGTSAEITGDGNINHTVTGSNPYLLTWANSDSSTTQALNPTAMAYNSVAMTAITGTPFTSGTRNAQGMWNLVAPATGVNALTTTHGSALPYIYGGWSYSGCKQSAQPDNSKTGTFNGTSYSSAIVTVADNCWVLTFIYGHFGGGSPSSLTNLTQRQASGGDPGWEYDNNAAVTPAGSLTQSATMGASTDWGFFQVSIAPFVAAAAGSRDARELTLLGVA